MSILNKKEFPLEWQESFYNDAEMMPIYKNSDVSKMLSRCQVRRIHKIHYKAVNDLKNL